MKIKRDKIMHFVTGVLGGCGLGLVFTPLAGVVLVAIVAMIKELWDLAGHGTPEVEDWLASVVGGCVGAGLADAIGLIW